MFRVPGWVRPFFDRLLKATPWMPLTLSTHPDHSLRCRRPSVAKAFVTSVQKAEGELRSAVSAGATTWLTSRTVVGTALAAGQTLLHLPAFRKECTSGASV